MADCVEGHIDESSPPAGAGHSAVSLPESQTDSDDGKMKISCVVTGLGSVGKTCLCLRYAEGTFPQEYIPTVFDYLPLQRTHAASKMAYELTIRDTGSDEGDRLRLLSFTDVDAVLICFSVVDRESFSRVKTHYLKEWKEAFHENVRPKKGAQIILIGTKLDIRDDPAVLGPLQHEWRTERGQPDWQPVSKSEGQKLATEIGAVRYVETSAKTPIGVTELFDDVLFQVATGKLRAKKKPSKCVVS